MTMKNGMRLLLLALGILSLASAQNGDPFTVCDSASTAPRFYPGCFVRIFEDDGSGRRLALFAPENAKLQSRMIRADRESTLVIDVSKALDSASGDVGLNRVYIRAVLKKGDSTKQIPVIGYSEIGEAEESKPAQTAFDFQTFANVAGKLTNLYFTTEDLITAAFNTKAEDCIKVLRENERPSAKDLEACPTNDKEALGRFMKRFRLVAPEAQILSGFFASGQNRGVTAELASKVFEIDIESLEAIAKQVEDARVLLDSNKITADARNELEGSVLIRVMKIYGDLGGLTSQVGHLANQFSRREVPKTTCPDAQRHYSHIRLKQLEIAKSIKNEFGRACLFEIELPRYLAELRKYLVEGTINLPKNDLAAGDVITLTVETKGKDPKGPGSKAEWQIRVVNTSWKAGVDGSLLFIRRLGVDERNPSLKPVRFSPFPGFTLGATYFGQRRRSVVVERTKEVDAAAYYSNLPIQESFGDRLGRVLQPGLGVNVTLMSFQQSRDFSLGNSQFASTTGASVEIGTGPVLSLFGNRLTVTYGWNLNQPEKRTYWGLGFGFVNLGKDIAGFFKKN
ncbi:MAG: hypothetical protein KIT83_01120 [Bryobacterales bacterium]|nr:hypothetical protein [Bryobacterales bacterium]